MNKYRHIVEPGWMFSMFLVQPARNFWIQQSEVQVSVPQIENEPVASWSAPPPRLTGSGLSSVCQHRESLDQLGYFSFCRLKSRWMRVTYSQRILLVSSPRQGQVQHWGLTPVYWVLILGSCQHCLEIWKDGIDSIVGNRGGRGNEEAGKQ